MSITNSFRRISSQLLLPCVTLYFAGTSLALAMQPGSYDVEVIIFSYRYPDSDGERWPVLSPETLMPPGFYSGDQVSERPVSSYKLNGISNGLRQSSAYSVLLHRAWRQPVHDAANAPAYRINTTAENGKNTLKGSIRLVRERFLHLDADLLMLPADNRAAVMDPQAPYTTPVFELREKRRINSNTVYYFDHPRFGLIATVTPYYSPAELQETNDASSAVEATEETAPVTITPAEDDQLTR